MSSKVRHRKLNKRKILKGRPEIFTFIKKRKAISIEEKPKENQVEVAQPHIRETIN